MAVGNVVDVLVEADASIPSLSEKVLIDGLVQAKAFEGRADAHELGTALCLCACKEFGVVFVVALNLRHAAEVAEVAPNELVAVEMLGHSPNLGVVALVVEHNHLANGNGTQVGLDALWRPGSLVADEEPSHLEPNGFGINTCQRFIDAS